MCKNTFLKYNNSAYVNMGTLAVMGDEFRRPVSDLVPTVNSKASLKSPPDPTAISVSQQHSEYLVSEIVNSSKLLILS